MKVLVGMSQTTAIPMSFILDKGKAAVSLPVLAQLPNTASSAQATLDLALMWEEEVVAVLLTSALMVASGFILVKAMIAKTLMLLLQQDSPTFKVSEEVQELSALKVHLTLNLPAPKLLSASSLLAQVLVVLRLLPYKSEARR